VVQSVKVRHVQEHQTYRISVTGCSSGIGEALAQYITKTSNRVTATARNPLSMSNIPDSPNVLKLKLDVTSIPSIEAALTETLAHFQRIDVVVNNAGYTLVGDTEAAGDAEARILLDTNFWGCVDVTKRALGIMRDENAKNDGQRGGVILNISSMGGWLGFPACSFYHASKFAMEGWTEAVAKELPGDWNSEYNIIRLWRYGDLRSTQSISATSSRVASKPNTHPLRSRRWNSVIRLTATRASQRTFFSHT
jgi:NADP-dependent 3-hydroxy acid dehydrogenase YdfG